MKRLRVEHLGRQGGQVAPLAGGIRVAGGAKWVRERSEACRRCEHQVVANYEERCALRPDWGCLGKARHKRDRECAAGRWGKASMRELKLNSL